MEHSAHRCGPRLLAVLLQAGDLALLHADPHLINLFRLLTGLSV